MQKSKVIERALDKLEALHARLQSSEPSPGADSEAGYAAMHLSRDATEIVHRELHEVADIAPGLRGREIYGETLDQAREYLRASMLKVPSKRGSPKEKIGAVAKLVQALREGAHAFRQAVLAKEVAILLLGPNRLGGVYAEWQTNTLGVGLLTWQEQESLNRRILGMARALDPKMAHVDAEREELPPVKYIEVGCFGNIAKACFRALADDALDGFAAEQVMEIGSHALHSIEREVAIDPDQYAEYKVATMYAMEAALREHLKIASAAETFWARVGSAKAGEIVGDVLRIEPSRRLQALVVLSARAAGVMVSEEAIRQRSESGLVERNDVRVHR